jgi:hypothetical protein
MDSARRLLPRPQTAPLPPRQPRSSTESAVHETIRASGPRRKTPRRPHPPRLSHPRRLHRTHEPLQRSRRNPGPGTRQDQSIHLRLSLERLSLSRSPPSSTTTSSVSDFSMAAKACSCTSITPSMSAGNTPKPGNNRGGWRDKLLLNADLSASKTCMPDKAKASRTKTMRSRTAARASSRKSSSLPRNEAEALERFKRLMTRYRGKLSFAGLDE